MKHIAQLLILIGAVAFAASGLQSCGKADELPPVDRNTQTGTRFYKLPDPTLLSTQEKAEVDAIKAEYDAATQ